MSLKSLSVAPYFSPGGSCVSIAEQENANDLQGNRVARSTIERIAAAKQEMRLITCKLIFTICLILFN
jgi:hypothetical protein